MPDRIINALVFPREIFKNGFSPLNHRWSRFSGRGRYRLRRQSVFWRRSFRLLRSVWADCLLVRDPLGLYQVVHLRNHCSHAEKSCNSEMERYRLGSRRRSASFLLEFAVRFFRDSSCPRHRRFGIAVQCFQCPGHDGRIRCLGQRTCSAAITPRFCILKSPLFRRRNPGLEGRASVFLKNSGCRLWFEPDRSALSDKLFA